MSAAQREPAPGCNPRPAEQSPSAASVVSNVPPAFDLREDAPGPSTAREREARASRARQRLREANERRRVGRALAELGGHFGAGEQVADLAMSDQWTRNLGNQLVREGFAAEYVAHLLGLPAPRMAVAA